MHKFWKTVEHYNTKLIPLAIILLLGVIIYELLLDIKNPAVELTVHTVDGFAIGIFVIDLIFLAIKARSVTFFFKRYWLDILAIFPFVIFFNIINNFYRLVLATERLTIGQAILHEGTALARSGEFVKVIRIVARSIRVITKSRLFVIFEAKHNLAKKDDKNSKKKSSPKLRKKLKK